MDQRTTAKENQKAELLGTFVEQLPAMLAQVTPVVMSLGAGIRFLLESGRAEREAERHHELALIQASPAYAMEKVSAEREQAEALEHIADALRDGIRAWVEETSRSEAANVLRERTTMLRKAGEASSAAMADASSAPSAPAT